jgi:hypothetical protein
MVELFAYKVTQSKVGEPTKGQFYTEFSEILKTFFDEFKSIKLVGTSNRPSETAPETACEGIANHIGKSFSSTEFNRLFYNATLSDGWTLGDALAVWYSLGNLALVVVVWTTYDKAKAPAIIDVSHPVLLKHWNMPADVLKKFVTVVGETEASAFAAYTGCKDGLDLSRFFGRYVSSILGAPVPFSERNMFQDELMGFKYRTDLVLTAEVCQLFIDTCIATKEWIGNYGTRWIKENV